MSFLVIIFFFFFSSFSSSYLDSNRRVTPRLPSRTLIGYFPTVFFSGEFFFILLRAHSCDANASRHLPHLSPIDSARGVVAAVVVAVAVAVVARESRHRASHIGRARRREKHKCSRPCQPGGATHRNPPPLCRKE